jgi:hypothetical protein
MSRKYRNQEKIWEICGRNVKKIKKVGLSLSSIKMQHKLGT